MGISEFYCQTCDSSHAFFEWQGCRIDFSTIGWGEGGGGQQSWDISADANRVCHSKLNSLCNDILISTVTSVDLKERNNPLISFQALSCLFCLRAPTGTRFNEGAG